MLVAYHGKVSEKKAILKQLRAHAAADELIQGQGWANGKGCAVGCTLHEYPSHHLYEERFGIPQVLARLEDAIFEGLPNAEAQQWPIQFMSAIRAGADLSGVWPKFAVWLLTDPTTGVLHFAQLDQRKTIQDVSDAYMRGETDIAVWRKLASAHASSASSASSAASAHASAHAAAHAAHAAAHAHALASSAHAAHAALASSAHAAHAAHAALAAHAVASSAHAASKKHYTTMATKLIELLAAP